MGWPYICPQRYHSSVISPSHDTVNILAVIVKVPPTICIVYLLTGITGRWSPRSHGRGGWYKLHSHCGKEKIMVWRSNPDVGFRIHNCPRRINAKNDLVRYVPHPTTALLVFRVSSPDVSSPQLKSQKSLLETP